MLGKWWLENFMDSRNSFRISRACSF